MIEARHAQLSFAEGLIAEEVTDLWDDWMRPADQVRRRRPGREGEKRPSVQLWRGRRAAAKV